MTVSLTDLRQEAQDRIAQLTQFPVQTNPPGWVSLVASDTGYTVVLSPPTQANSNPYLPQAAGLDYPVTQAANSTNIPTFTYQVQFATDAIFTQGLQTYSMGTSPTITVQLTGTYYAQAQVQFINGVWSNWVPFGSAVATTTSTYRPIYYVTSGSGTATTPSLAMDGDLSTFAIVVASAGANFSVTWGPFASPFQLSSSGLTLFAKSSATNSGGSGTAQVSYSFNAGDSYTDFENNPGWALTTDSVAVPANINLGIIRVQAKSTNIAASTNTINVYEIYIQ